MLRIAGGEFRSRQLSTPPDDRTSRPYTQRVKEAVFNLLRGWCDDARVLDLFAGVGTIGLEAVSRGAKEVVLIEQDRRIFEMLKANIALLDCADRAHAVKADALGTAVALRAPAPVDLLFVDPPYPIMQDDGGRTRVLGQIERLRDVMADSSFVVLRSPLDPKRTDLSIPGYDGPEVHRYATDMWVCLYAPENAPENGAAT